MYRFHQSEKVSPMQMQKLTRLRVNRVALLQTLKVEHILSHLIQHDVIDEDDIKKINSDSNQQNRVKILLDILPSKGRTIDWYKHFRDALKSPAVRNKDIQRKYQILVEFLDNTIIHPPQTSVDPIDFKESDFSLIKSALSDEDEHEPTSSKKNGSQPIGIRIDVPPTFKSCLKKPRRHFQLLVESKDSDDQQQLEQEEDAFIKMQTLEAVYTIFQQNQLPHVTEFCQTKAVEDIVFDIDNHHLYFKYMDQLEFYDETSVCMVKQIAASVINFIKQLDIADDEEMVKYVVKLTFSLTQLMREYGMYYHAEAVIIALMAYLKTNTVLQNWMTIRNGFIKIMGLRNTNLDFPGVEWAFNAAQNMTRNIKIMSFGQHLLDESDMFLQLNIMLLEQGSVTPAFHWAQAAIRVSINFTIHQFYFEAFIICILLNVMISQYNLFFYNSSLISIFAFQMEFSGDRFYLYGEKSIYVQCRIQKCDSYIVQKCMYNNYITYLAFHTDC